MWNKYTRKNGEYRDTKMIYKRTTELEILYDTAFYWSALLFWAKACHEYCTFALLNRYPGM